MDNGIHTKHFSQMIGGTSCWTDENGEFQSEPCPTVGAQIARYLEKYPQYELIDQINVTEPRVMNDHSVKAFFQLKTDYNIKEAAHDMLDALLDLQKILGEDIGDKAAQSIEKALK